MGSKSPAAGRCATNRVRVGESTSRAHWQRGSGRRIGTRSASRDNGIGFDEKYLDRIFTIFQRLHGRDEYEGAGVGLAVCRKIVERHGGTITATSALQRGSTFLLTLPGAQPALGVVHAA